MEDFTHRFVELFDEHGVVIFILWAINVIWMFSKDDTKELAGCGCIVPIIAFILYILFKTH